ncbi:hypothetical protein QVA66_03085 [Staphylococcus chromogenes]|nr:hypothetical protein [Staphylococcus chromogenes]
MFRKIVRYSFGTVFAAGVMIHIVAGLRSPSGYAAFGSTAGPPLADAWAHLIMPNIQLLAICMAAIEGCIAYGLFRGGRATRMAVQASCVFFVVLVFLGYGWPTETLWEDFLKNRLGSLLMLGLMLPVAVESGKDAPTK